MNPLTWIKDNVTRLLGGVMVIGMLVLGAWLTIALHQRNGARAGWAAETKAHAQTIANYRAAADKARADDLANARDVEHRNASIAEEKQRGLTQQLADARAAAADYARRLQQRAAAGADPRGGGKPGVSVAADPAGGVAGTGAATELADAEACARAFVIATGWQDYWRDIVAADKKLRADREARP